MRAEGMVRVLYVCTANICRSVSAQQVLRFAVSADPHLAGIEVGSAGTSAMADTRGCPVAPALAGYARDHRSRALTAELVAAADLVLPATREHRAAVVALVPAARARTFTIRQAGRIADWLMDTGMVAAALERRATKPSAWGRRFARGDLRRDVTPLPEAVEERWPWLVTEMDAARGLTGTAPTENPPEPVPVGRRARGGRHRRTSPPGSSPAPRGTTFSAGSPVPGADGGQTHPDDVPDPHVLGMGLHPLAYDQIKAATDSLVRLLRETASAS